MWRRWWLGNKNGSGSWRSYRRAWARALWALVILIIRAMEGTCGMDPGHACTDTEVRGRVSTLGSGYGA